MVGDDHMFIYPVYAVDIIQHTSEDSVAAYFEQGLGKIPCQFSKAGGIPGGYYDIFHD